MLLTHTVTEKDSGRKIKYFVRSDLKISYHQYCVMKSSGLLKVNGNPIRSDYVISEGDVITAELEETGGNKSVSPENGTINVCFEDEDLIVLDKEAPLACQCTPKQPFGTLENRICFKYGADFVFRPVNRLDKGTSGLMCVAKHAHAYHLLQKQLHTPSFEREYLAVSEGLLCGNGIIDRPIAKDADATVKRIIDDINGKPARTHYQALYSANNRTLVRLRLETGRTHQIRVHLSSIGHPVCGDFLYGHELQELPGRFALHSCSISFIHPLSGEMIHIASELPDNLKELIND